MSLLGKQEDHTPFSTHTLYISTSLSQAEQLTEYRPGNDQNLAPTTLVVMLAKLTYRI